MLLIINLFKSLKIRIGNSVFGIIFAIFVVVVWLSQLDKNEEDAFLVFNFYRDIYRKTHETLYGTIELNEPDGEAEFEDDLDA